MSERVLSEVVEFDVDRCLRVYGESSCKAGRRFSPSLDFDFIGTVPSLTPVIGSATLAVTRAGATATRVNSLGLIETVAADTPRFDYDPVTLVCKGLLIEETRANFALRSTEFDNAVWAKTDLNTAIVTANTTIAPDGTLSADTVDSGAAISLLRQTCASVSAGQSVSCTIYVKQGTALQSTLNCYATGDTETNSTLTWATKTVDIGTLKDAGGGWYRWAITLTVGVTGNFLFRLWPSGRGAGLGTVVLWNAQPELGTFPTSAILTTSAAVTRNTDQPAIASLGSWFNAAEGTISTEWDIAFDSATSLFPMSASFNDGTFNTRISVYERTIDDAAGFSVVAGGVSQADQVDGVYVYGSVARQAFAYKLNDFAMSYNGRPVSTDNAGTVPTVTRLDLGGQIGSNALNGHLRRFTYYNSRLVNASLVTLAGLGVIDRANACYNTFRTCQDKVDYLKGVQTIRFTGLGSPIDKSAPSRPYISRIATAPTEIDPEQGSSRRAMSTIVMTDVPDSDVEMDPYVRDRLTVAKGTFWRRFFARNLNYGSRPARVKRAFVDHGVFGTYTTERFIIDSAKGPASNGDVSFTLKDPVKLLDRTKAPTPTSGKLAVDLTTSDLQATLDAGSGAQYAASGWVRIGDEVIRYASKAGDVLSWPDGTYRGQFNTVGAAGAIGDGVQQCLVYLDSTFRAVIQNLHNLAGIVDADMDLAQLASEEATWLADDFHIYRACITDPEDISVLMQELLQPAGMTSWWSPIDQKVKFQVYAPASPAALSVTVLDDASALIEDSVALERLEDLRITMTAMNFGLNHSIDNVTEAKNYKQAEIAIDADAESANEYNERRPLTLYSRFYGSSNTRAMRTFVQRYVARHRDAPERVEFTLDPKDGALKEGQLADMKTYRLVDKAGAIRTARILVIRREPIGTQVKYAGRITNFDRPYAFIAPDGTPNYPNNNGYACISQNNGLMTNGDAGYLII